MVQRENQRNKESASYPHILVAAAGIFIAYITVYVLVVADRLLIPLVLAVLLWYLINTIDHTLSRIRIRSWCPPRWLRLLLAITVLAVAVNMVSGIIAASVSSIIRAAPDYQSKLERLLHDMPFGIELEEVPVLSQLTAELNIGRLMQRVARDFAGLLGNFGLIIVYLFFLFLEGRHFSKKLAAALVEPEHQQRVTDILARIDHDIKRYIGVKTLLSLATAVGAWIIMRIVGLDFAEFWAVLIFVLNFIPNLGSIVATILPSVLALLQFDTYPPFFIILIGLGSLQMLIGNLLDPALMGKSLNVSPLIIIFSLVLWSAIWGLPGMFLCVPIMVILMIILSNFESTRWIAVMMSRDGRFKK